MKAIKEFLFGRRNQSVETFKSGVTTIYPSNQPAQWDWMIEFRVGMLYDRKTLFIN